MPLREDSPDPKADAEVFGCIQRNPGATVLFIEAATGYTEAYVRRVLKRIGSAVVVRRDGRLNRYEARHG